MYDGGVVVYNNVYIKYRVIFFWQIMTTFTLTLEFFRASIYLNENIIFPCSGEITNGGFAMIWVAVNSGGYNDNSGIWCLCFWHLTWRSRLASWGGRKQSWDIRAGAEISLVLSFQCMGGLWIRTTLLHFFSWAHVHEIYFSKYDDMKIIIIIETISEINNKF